MRTQKKFAEISKFVRTQKLTMLYLASYVLVAVALVQRYSVADQFGSGKEQLEREGHSASDQEKGQEGEVQHAEQDEKATGG